MALNAIIAKIEKNSLAAKANLNIGDKILTVNGESVKNIIDLSFAFADEKIDLFVEDIQGNNKKINIKKKYDENLGLEFESAVFDKIKECTNNCVFCFVSQMPAGLRESLYVKDDDYRLSFLTGSFITLTNLTEDDFKRIRQFHLSPLHISVHTTNPSLRVKMMNNKKAGIALNWLNKFQEKFIDFHAQVVLCPNINDGKELDKTIEDLINLQPSALSMAIVPVGLTKFRDNCPSLNSFDKKSAQNIIEQVNKWREYSLKKFNNPFVQLADEFYFLAEYDLPDTNYYDGFPQIENGVGISRNFIDEWDSIDKQKCDLKEHRNIDILCGKSAQKVLKELLNNLKIENTSINLIPIENSFFGENITVTGLLTGIDILNALKTSDKKPDFAIIPGITLRKSENVFLDGMTLDEFKELSPVEIKIANDGIELKKILLNLQ